MNPSIRESGKYDKIIDYLKEVNISSHTKEVTLEQVLLLVILFRRNLEISKEDGKPNRYVYIKELKTYTDKVGIPYASKRLLHTVLTYLAENR